MIISGALLTDGRTHARNPQKTEGKSKNIKCGTNDGWILNRYLSGCFIFFDAWRSSSSSSSRKDNKNDEPRRSVRGRGGVNSKREIPSKMEKGTIRRRRRRREKKEEHNKNISRKMEGKHEKNIRGHVFNRLTWDWQPKQAAKCVSNKATRGIQESRRRENPRYLEAMAKQKNRDTMQRIPISSK